MADFGKLPFQVAFDPSTGFILDARQYFETYEAALAAAQSAKEMGSKETVYYYGMQLLVDDGKDAIWYRITRSNTLVPLDSGGGGGGSDLPNVTEEDNDKFLKVVDGKWSAAHLPVYDGEYAVVPSTENDQLLETAQKLMDANVKVNKVPYAEVTNTMGGTTATIGSEV